MTIKYLYTDSHYEYTLEIIFTTNVKRSLSNLYRKWNIEEEVFDCEACTVTCQDKDNEIADISKYGLIFSFDKLTENIICHEVAHLAAFILDDRSIDLQGGNDDYENFAWLCGHLSQIVHQVINKEELVIYQENIPAKIKKI
jgi:hypothetical protein